MDAPLFLAELQKRREKQGITVRVVRKWTVMENQGRGDPLYVGMVFADAQGGAMYAEIPAKIMPDKEYLLDVGKVYKIKKFNVRSAKEAFKVINGPLMIEFSEYTTIEFVPDPPHGIPEYVYNLTNFADIAPVDGLVIQYTDVIGYLTKYTALETFVPKNKENVIMLRELYIKDLRQNELQVTIWGDYATNFTVDHVYDEKAGNLVVCLLLGCVLRRSFRNYNEIYLTTSSTFSYHLDPQIVEAQDYYDRFKDTPVFIERPPTTEVLPLPQVRPSPLQLKTVAELNAIVDPFDFEDGTYKYEVTITSVLQTGRWWYMACKPCKKKAMQQTDRSYRCTICGSSNTVPRYLLTFMAKDDTDEARFFAYDSEAKIIVGKDCEAVMSPLGLAGGVPQQILNIVDKKYVFSVDLDGGPNRQYIVKAVLVKPSWRSLQGDNISLQEIGGSSSAGQITESQKQTLQIEAASCPTVAAATIGAVIAPTTGLQEPGSSISSTVAPANIETIIGTTTGLQEPGGSASPTQTMHVEHELLQIQSTPQLTPLTSAGGMDKSGLPGSKQPSNARRSLLFETDALADKVTTNKAIDTNVELISDDDTPLVEASTEQPSKRRRTGGGKQGVKLMSSKSASSSP